MHTVVSFHPGDGLLAVRRRRASDLSTSYRFPNTDLLLESSAVLDGNELDDYFGSNEWWADDFGTHVIPGEA
jgi:hypothetical protein